MSGIVLLSVMCLVMTACDGSDERHGWRLLQDSVVPYPNSDRTVVYDSHRDVVIVHGGTGLSDTWEWDGKRWTEYKGDSHPPACSGSSSCYDPFRQRTYLLSSDPHYYWERPTMFFWEYDGSCDLGRPYDSDILMSESPN